MSKVVSSIPIRVPGFMQNVVIDHGQTDDLIICHQLGIVIRDKTALDNQRSAAGFQGNMLALAHPPSYTLTVMKVNQQETVQVSFRLERQLVDRMREISNTPKWPPPPSQTEIVTRGIELVLNKLNKRRARSRAEA